MRKTLRPKNVCNDCGNTWYPRGRDLSYECTRCKSNNVRYSREGLLKAIVFVAIVAFSSLTQESSKPKNDQANVVEIEPVSLNNIENSEFDDTQSQSDATPNEQKESENPVSEVQTDLIDNPKSISPSVHYERRELFSKWSESEQKLRDVYTQLLNNSSSKPEDLEHRNKEYLSFVNLKNKKCGDLTSKISSNINSDVSRIEFSDEEVPLLECHLKENSLELSRVSSENV
jgi:hypothetical protein